MIGKLRLAPLAALACAWVLAAPGAADAATSGQCGYNWCWGAVAIGEQGKLGRSSSMRTAPDAYDRALSVCGDDCKVEVFVNSCGAIARDYTGAWAYGGGDSREIAEKEAVAACELGGSACRVVNWACSF